MEELLVIALGALAVIAAPLVPGVHPLAKSAVKGGMALGSAAAAATFAAGQQWDHVADKVGSKKSEAYLPAIESTAMAVVEAAQATSESAAAKVGDAADDEVTPGTGTAGDGGAAVPYQKGLEFPDGELVDYWAFMYCSFTIAMCYQTSDVTITGSLMHRMTLLHTIVSFAFVLVILGYTVNALNTML